MKTDAMNRDLESDGQTGNRLAKPLGKRVIRIVVGLVIVMLLGACAWWFWNSNKAPTVSFTTAPVKRGSLVATIGATGTIEPEEVIDVGAQVAGLINAFGKDKNGKPIDYGSEIETGMVLARIDDSMYAADAAEAVAQVKQATAQVAAAEANLDQLKAKLDQAQRDWDRARKIGPSDALAVSAYDAYRSAFDGAKANVTAGEAAILQARAAVTQAEAAASRAQLNLGYCVIKSPVDGVIIDRRVNIGQTVVASLNAPSLFLIAKDLKRMQLWVAVNEADIGSLKPGQPVTFTVDAYPGQVFKGAVSKVRLNATMTQNVVTYTVEVVTDNSDGRLLPYLTANAQFQVAQRDDVLMVPNAALRWQPQPAMIAPDARTQTRGAGRRPAGAGGFRHEADKERANDPEAGMTRGTVWMRDGEYVRPVRVRVGITDGTTTEVKSDKLTETTEVVVAETAVAERSSPAAAGGSAAASNAPSPFTPQFPSRQRGGR